MSLGRCENHFRGAGNGESTKVTVYRKQGTTVYWMYSRLGVSGSECDPAIHPEVLAHEGSSYKSFLEKMVSDLGLSKHVVFHNQFVDEQQLRQFLCAADIYVTPYLKKQQLTSGTLAFALGAGKAVVSTPYWAAQPLMTIELTGTYVPEPATLVVLAMGGLVALLRRKL